MCHGRWIAVGQRTPRRALVAVDINTEFVELVRSRYAKTLPQLELLEADIEACELEYRAFDLVHCALLLEYVDVNVVLKKMARWVSDTGVIVVVLQLAFPDSSPVSDTGCESLKLLKMELHTPGEIRDKARCVRLKEVSSRTVALESGKRFYVGHFML